MFILENVKTYIRCCLNSSNILITVVMGNFIFLHNNILFFDQYSVQFQGILVVKDVLRREIRSSHGSVMDYIVITGISRFGATAVSPSVGIPEISSDI